MSAPPQDPRWTAAEREDFFAAIARHRARAWRVSAVAALCGAVVALVVALLLSPLLFGLTALVLDLANFVVPTPDLFQHVMAALEPLLGDDAATNPAALARFALAAALPGMLLVAATAWLLARLLRRSALFDGGAATGRAPDPGDLEEQRFANTVAEMAIAAGLPPPRVRVVDAAIGNAAVFGRDEAHATILVGEGLLGTLSRAQMQGVAAHLVASIANGDLRIGLRMALVLALFGVIGRLALVVTEPAAWRTLLALPRLALRPRHADATLLALDLAQPFAAEAAPATHRAARGSTPGWREYLKMPLMGPLAMTGFFGGLVATFALAPLLALAWRQRKYLADASAVRLSRDPQAVADALHALAATPHVRTLAPWADHAAVVPGGSKAGLLGGGVVPMFPALERRLAALARLGARIERAAPARGMTPLAWILLGPLAAAVVALLCVALVLLVWVSVMLSALFTWLPIGLFGLLLRWLAG